MNHRITSSLTFVLLLIALLFGLGSGCKLFKKEKEFFLNAAPHLQNCEIV